MHCGRCDAKVPDNASVCACGSRGFYRGHRPKRHLMGSGPELPNPEAEEPVPARAKHPQARHTRRFQRLAF